MRRLSRRKLFLQGSQDNASRESKMPTSRSLDRVVSGTPNCEMPPPTSVQREHVQSSQVDLRVDVPGTFGNEASNSQDHISSSSHSSTGPMPRLASSNTKKRRRGRTILRNITTLPDDQRIALEWNDRLQPIGENRENFVNYIGIQARNGALVPIHYMDWHEVPQRHKDEAWNLVKKKFVVTEQHKNWVMRKLGDRWRAYRNKLKVDYYDQFDTNKERIRNCPPDVHLDQWKQLVKYFSSDLFQARSGRGKSNRAKHTMVHVCGSKSFAQIREELKNSHPDKREPTRIEVFRATRQKKNGDIPNEDVCRAIRSLDEIEMIDADNSQSSNGHQDALSQVLGAEHSGYARMFGFGPTPSKIWGKKVDRLKMENDKLLRQLEEERAEKEQLKSQQEQLKAQQEQMKAHQDQMESLMTSMMVTLSQNGFINLSSILHGSAPITSQGNNNEGAGASHKQTSQQ
ncbi:PREDICTED: uncharacterized protein LOC104595071 isoform X2 [Nelumbo nucifera]|uniref:Uncharacterized protein LOC104595071 isoform X2 n=1 Tax=Nelumbo nucifera TaxID=4432 RepID=A0A1U7ZPX5_NELNU|nr:PREDICTED: uncharacterized protein LOC104595071 isoform X2 [Nelumbo nucifera]